MSGIVASTSACAISAEEQSGRMVGPIRPQSRSYAPSEWFPLMARALWSSKAPAAICDLAELDEEEDRKARKWASGFNEVPGWLVVVLLRSKEGFRVLTWLMSDNPPDWWWSFQQERKLAAIARDIFKRLEEGVDAGAARLQDSG